MILASYDTTFGPTWPDAVHDIVNINVAPGASNTITVHTFASEADRQAGKAYVERNIAAPYVAGSGDPQEQAEEWLIAYEASFSGGTQFTP